jgi:hypothetical protein
MPTLVTFPEVTLGATVPLTLMVPIIKPNPTRAKLAIAMRTNRVKRTDSTATPIELQY